MSLLRAHQCIAETGARTFLLVELKNAALQTTGGILKSRAIRHNTRDLATLMSPTWRQGAHWPAVRAEPEALSVASFVGT